MIESFVITLREGIEVALLVGILLSYVDRVGRKPLNFSVYFGLAAGTALSFLIAFLFSRVDVNEELYEGSVMLLSAVFVGSMVVWMLKTAKFIKRDIEQKLQNVLSAPDGTPSVSKWSFPLIGFVTLCVLREGVETVVFLSAVSLSTSELLSFLGGVLGLFLSAVFGYLFVRGSIVINLARFFKITGAVLLLFAFQLVVSGVHEFGEAGIIPVSDREMAMIGPVVKHNMLFLFAILSIPLFAVIFPGEKKGEKILLEKLPSPERRKILAKKKAEQRFRTASSLVGFLALFALSFQYVHAKSPQKITPPIMMTPENGRIAVPVSELADGKLHRYGAALDGKLLRFLLMKTPDGRIRSGFDACRICGSKGYIQEGSRLICLNCAADIQGATLGQGGGCNPIPLFSKVEKDAVVIQTKDLLKQEKIFDKTDVPEVVDPVCGMKLKLDMAGGQVKYKGKTYYFCRMPTCKKEFKAHPENFAK